MISVSLSVVPLRTSARMGSPAAADAALAFTGSFGFAPASGTAASTNSVVPAAISLALAMMPPQNDAYPARCVGQAPPALRGQLPRDPDRAAARLVEAMLGRSCSRSSSPTAH